MENTISDRSSAFCLPAINNGLALANPNGKPWRTTTAVQKAYLETYGMSGFDTKLLGKYLKGMVTQDSVELNRWFADNGWPMSISIPLGGLGIGSIFDLLVDWQVPGRKKESGICIAQGNDRVFCEGGEMSPSEGLTAYTLYDYAHPMFELSTQQDGWKVFLVKADGPCNPFTLPKIAHNLLNQARSTFVFTKLEFPFVRLEADVDIRWMVGMGIEGGFHIDEAVKKVKLTLDDKGARAQSAVAYTMRGMTSGVYTLNTPFYVIFWHEDLSYPAFVALSASDSWTRVCHR